MQNLIQEKKEKEEINEVKPEKIVKSKKKIIINNDISLKEIMKSQSTGRRKLANEG